MFSFCISFYSIWRLWRTKTSQQHRKNLNRSNRQITDSLASISLIQPVDDVQWALHHVQGKGSDSARTTKKKSSLSTCCHSYLGAFRCSGTSSMSHVCPWKDKNVGMKWKLHQLSSGGLFSLAAFSSVMLELPLSPWRNGRVDVRGRWSAHSAAEAAE